MVDVSLKCRCGDVRGVARDVSAKNGTRLICYCDDCQAYAHYLGCADEALDKFGGTDVFQTAPAKITITAGADRLRSLRLRPKSLIRWYSDCCKTPIGNTISGKVPMVGIVHCFMADEGLRDDNLGAVRFHVQGKHALNPPPHDNVQDGFGSGLLLRMIGRIAIDRIYGRGHPSPFFGRDGMPVSEPVICEEKH